jgi:dipeptidase D
MNNPLQTPRFQVLSRRPQVRRAGRPLAWHREGKMTFVSDLEPNSLWRYFDKILTIPRASKDEGRIRDYVIGVAQKLGLEHQSDEIGNVVVRKPASAGVSPAPTVVFQAHLDMVEEKNSDVEHDFRKDPIRPQRDGDWLTASGTTLGSDNGIGVASMLALMEDKELKHGPLEFLFTVDEETGLTGASNLAKGMLEGRMLINCDSEEEGVLTVGCAGGADSHLYLPLTRSAVAGASGALRLQVSGLKGGHSGIDIRLQRANAIRLLARALYSVSLHRSFRSAEFAGGSAHNAIPREASATVVAASGDLGALREALQREGEAACAEFRSADPEARFAIDAIGAPSDAWDEATTAQALALLTGLPHGVAGMSYNIPELVETSTNLATVGEQDGRLTILMSTRSSVASALAALSQRIRAIGTLAGAEVEEGGGYPGWTPNMQSPLLEVVRSVHRQVAGQDPEVGAVHAGLECGIIGEKYPGMDMISVGPQIEFPHSPDERVKIDTVSTFYRILTTTLERLAG